MPKWKVIRKIPVHASDGGKKKAEQLRNQYGPAAARQGRVVNVYEMPGRRGKPTWWEIRVEEEIED
jgi:hypothetical protein